MGARGRPMGGRVRKIKHTDPLTAIDPESSWPSRHLKVAGEVLCGQFYTLTRFPCLFVRRRPLKGSPGFRIVFAICPTSSLTAWITKYKHLVPRSKPLKRSTVCPPLSTCFAPCHWDSQPPNLERKFLVTRPHSS